MTPAQKDLCDLWVALSLERRGARDGVARARLDPGRMRRYLSRLVLLECFDDGRRRVRLAGSVQCRELGIDPSGHTLGELPPHISLPLGLGVDQAILRNRPVVARLVSPQGDTRLTVLRLPLLNAQGEIGFVLCLDVPSVPGEGVTGDDIPNDIHDEGGSIAA